MHLKNKLLQKFLRSSKTKMSAFIQRLNPLTGTNEWTVANENYDYHQEVARAAFADMLHDTERNEMYEQSIKIAIESMHSKGRPANVLDIGTGTGLLSLMAVRHKADTVTACEAFDPMSKCASEVISINNCKEKIKIIPKRSTDIVIGQDMPFKANILVTEVFDTELIGEGALATFQHAHQHLLEKDCIVVPHSGTIYAQIVESPLLTSWNTFKDVYDEDGELALKAPESIKNCHGSINLHDLQLSELPLEYIKTIVSPQAVLKFDFSGKTPIVFQRTLLSTAKAERDGVAQAVFMWWDLNMDIGNKIVLSCAPYWAHPLQKDKKSIPWRDHWMQAIYYFPQELSVKKGQEINLVCSHDEFSLWFGAKSQLKISEGDFASPTCTCNLHNAFSRTRIGQLNDGRRNKKYLHLISEHVNERSVVLVLSHGFLAALSAAKVAKKVYILEPNALCKSITEEFAKINNLTVEIIDLKHEIKEKIDVVLAEPYFVTSIVPWDNLLLVYLLKKFSYCLKEDTKIFPQRALIRTVALQFDNLHKIRAPLVTCQGFQMKAFDTLIEDSCGISDDTVEAQPLWEYPAKALTEIKDVAEVNVQAVVRENDTYESKIPFDIPQGSVCNGIAVWVDWIFDSSDPKSRITTGPLGDVCVGEYIEWDMYTRQGVVLLGNRKLPQNFTCSFSYDCQNASIKFRPDL